MTTVVWITVAIFAMSGLVKLLNVPMSLAERDKLGQSPGKWRIIGTLEVLGVLGVAGALTGYVPRPLGIAAAVGFVMLMVGAMGIRISHGARENKHDWLLIADVLTFALAIATLVAMIQL
jgi:hypothetical protein